MAEKQLVACNKVFDIPQDLQLCPYCGAPLRASVDCWTEETATVWKAEHIDLECGWQPAFELLNSWRQWDAVHTNMPYVYWLPACTKVEAWINDNFRFSPEL
jgi:hypothetical protein